jgi:hypothetical protein
MPDIDTESGIVEIQMSRPVASTETIAVASGAAQ